MTPVDGAVLLGLFVIVGLFVAYEMEGLQQKGALWHTVSWEAQHHRWIARGIAALGAISFIVFEFWWRHHLGTVIPR